jgi:hypothetical protein
MAEFYKEGFFMKIDETIDAAPDTVSAQDQQNRREFFNGLGKWSMVVIAAVSFLRGSVTRLHAAREGSPRPEWESPDPASRKLAKKKHRQHVDIPGGGHYNTPHGDVPHVDKNIMQRRGGQPSGQPPPAKMYE